MRCLLLCVFVLAVLADPAAASEAPEATAGMRLSDYLVALKDEGLNLVYTSDLVGEDLRLGAEPAGTSPEERLQSALRPFGLEAVPGPAGSLIVVRRPGAGGEERQETIAAAPERVPIPEVVVTSSLHRLQYQQPELHHYLDRDLATRVPTVADEAVRLTDRLPGTANGGVSTRNHIRGGEANEVLFLLDGLRLYEPYHLKQFQAIATIVNSGAIDGMDFFTGAYPARFGDRMSGVMSIDLRTPAAPRETEIALSFFNTSLVSLGTFGGAEQGDWLVSARRGNLDLIVDLVEPDYGSPDYHDLLGHVGWAFGPRTALSANLLYAKDKLGLNDADRGERAGADYVNTVFWLKWQAEWNDTLHSDTIAAYSDISNRRNGSVALEGVVAGTLAERNTFSVLELRQDWEWVPNARWMLRAGANLKRLEAAYRFSSNKEVEAPFDELFGNQGFRDIDTTLDPAGAQYAAYAEWRWRALPVLTFDLGIRWDLQTYTTAADDSQVSPRVGVLFEPAEGTSLRLGWGRYSQAQEINELQVSDGVNRFYAAQRAEHLVVSLQQAFPGGLAVELSAYRKRFDSVKPYFENAYNSLTLLPELQFDRVQVDPASAEAAGLELMLSRGDAADDLLWWLGYSWARAEDFTASGDVLRSWDQTHTLKAGLSWRWGGWNFSAAGEVHTGWPRSSLTGELVAQPGGPALVLEASPRNVTRFADFNTLDVRVSREVDVSRGTLTAFLEVSNLYDRANPCCTEYSVAEDGSLAERHRNWLPLVPSLGVVWRF